MASGALGLIIIVLSLVILLALLLPMTCVCMSVCGGDETKDLRTYDGGGPFDGVFLRSTLKQEQPSARGLGWIETAKRTGLLKRFNVSRNQLRSLLLDINNKMEGSNGIFRPAVDAFIIYFDNFFRLVSTPRTELSGQWIGTGTDEKWASLFRMQDTAKRVLRIFRNEPVKNVPKVLLDKFLSVADVFLDYDILELELPETVLRALERYVRSPLTVRISRMPEADKKQSTMPDYVASVVSESVMPPPEQSGSRMQVDKPVEPEERHLPFEQMRKEETHFALPEEKIGPRTEILTHGVQVLEQIKKEKEEPQRTKEETSEAEMSEGWKMFFKAAEQKWQPQQPRQRAAPLSVAPPLTPPAPMAALPLVAPAFRSVAPMAAPLPLLLRPVAPIAAADPIEALAFQPVRQIIEKEAPKLTLSISAVRGKTELLELIKFAENPPINVLTQEMIIIPDTTQKQITKPLKLLMLVSLAVDMHRPVQLTPADLQELQKLERSIKIPGGWVYRGSPASLYTYIHERTAADIAPYIAAMV